MAYGEHYKYYFYWDHNSSNNYYKVSFLEDGYASTVTTLTPGPNPFSLSYKGQKDSLSQLILGSEANMEIIVAKADVDDIDAEFMSSDHKHYLVKLIQDPDGTPITKWVGYLFPASSTREYLGFKFTYTLSAIDGLAGLKDFKYSSSGDDYGTPYSGYDNMLSIIKTALSKSINLSDLQLDFRVYLGTYSDQMTSTENALKENEIAQELFYTETDDGYDFNTCYEVIEKILKPFFCKMALCDGYFWIWCLGERNSYYFEYDWTTLTQQSRTSLTRSLTFQGISGYKLFGRGTLTKISGYGEYNVSLYNKLYDAELATNSGFDSDVSGWTNGDADDSTNAWDAFDFYSYPAVGGTASMQWAGSASAGKYNFHSSSAITFDVSGGAGTVYITYSVERNSETPSGLTSPKVQARLWNSTNLYTSSNEGQRTLGNVGGFYTYTDSFTVVGLVAANYIDIEIEVVDATTTSVQFYANYVSVKQPNVITPTDQVYRSILQGGTQKDVIDDIIYIGDQLDGSDDICSIKDSGGTYTSTWDRYGKTADDIPLVKILQQYVMNAHNATKDYVTCTAYDPDETILINTMLYDFALGLTTRYFDIIGMTVNYRDATIDLQLNENGILPSADTSLYFTNYNTSTQYGQST